MPVEAIHGHIDTAEFDDDVRALCEAGNIVLPLTENLGAFAFVGTDAERPTEMIKDNCSIGKGFSEVRHLPHLGMVLPCLETEVQTFQLGKALAKTR